MKTKEEIIHDMCVTYRHDFGLDKSPNDPPWIAGMTKEEREGLYRTMEQLYEHHIRPILEYYKKLETGESVVLPTSKEHAEYMVRVGMFYLEQKNDR